jgi:acetyltransferase
MSDIVRITPEQLEAANQQFAGLLIDAVDSGASVGFMPPLGIDEASSYWSGVASAMREGSRILLAVFDEGLLQGSVQLALEMRPNGHHRAEVMKLFVHRRARRRGLAKSLMAAAESAARQNGRTLLLMDTRIGGEAEKLCLQLGYVKFGEVPEYARSSDGRLHTTAFFYHQLA